MKWILFLTIFIQPKSYEKETKVLKNVQRHYLKTASLDRKIYLVKIEKIDYRNAADKFAEALKFAGQ